MPEIHYDDQALQLLGVPGARLANGLRQLDVSESTIQELLRNDLGLDDRAVGEALTAAKRLADEGAAAVPLPPVNETETPRRRSDDPQS
ncbi:MAG: hypothetical protein JWL73_2424 [Actinomycetia bacterium]|nr:hypothetical protein [Actinomycetes bacterium]